MRQFQSMSKGREARDFNLIQDNSSYVQTWSMAQIAVVIICTVVQVSRPVINCGSTYTAQISGPFREKFIQRPARSEGQWWKLQDANLNGAVQICEPGCANNSFALHGIILDGLILRS